MRDARHMGRCLHVVTALSRYIARQHGSEWRRTAMGSRASTQNPGDTLKPKQTIRRFDIFAEYNRLKGLEKGMDEPHAQGYGLWVAKVVASGGGPAVSTRQRRGHSKVRGGRQHPLGRNGMNWVAGPRQMRFSNARSYGAWAQTSMPMYSPPPSPKPPVRAEATRASVMRCAKSGTQRARNTSSA